MKVIDINNLPWDIIRKLKDSSIKKLEEIQLTSGPKPNTRLFWDELDGKESQ